ncbi:unnamed protein product, partial [Phaeothamnion confervicola]
QKLRRTIWLSLVAVLRARSETRPASLLQLLQGQIWRSGYASGAIHGEVYADVPEAFARWTAAGETRRRVCIYSSGSREAQQLLFRHSCRGDLMPHLSCLFDTTVGHKNESLSYKQIALSLGVRAPAEVLFLTDVLAEARAAAGAGLQASSLLRLDNGFNVL